MRVVSVSLGEEVPGGSSGGFSGVLPASWPDFVSPEKGSQVSVSELHWVSLGHPVSLQLAIHVKFVLSLQINPLSHSGHLSPLQLRFWLK